LRERAQHGAATIFISHRMDEIAEIGDRCTVMRSGDTVGTLERGDATAEELVRLMTGSDHLTGDPASRPERTLGDVVLAVDGLDVRAGELVGLAGLEGHGQDAFLRMLSERGGEGAAYVPRERRAESIFESKSIRENFGIVTLDRDARSGLLSNERTRARLTSYVERLAIKLRDPEDAITTLSGGNQQKIVLARWLATDPKVLLLNDPTRGVDINAKRDIYRLLLGLAEAGVAVVMLSTEVDEHVELMDRVLVFRGGSISRELSREQLSRQAIVSAFFMGDASVA
jgi:ABC-type sugar transport system ATPase subunit